MLPRIHLGTAAASTLLVAGLGLFVGPSLAAAFSTIGGSLGVGTTGNGYQRDVRSWNNAVDAAANNNVTTESAFPGALGAPLAVWKGAQAWSSNNPNAGRNFDMDWQGEAFASGGTNGNVASWGDSGCGGGVLAYTETPISDGWRILFCESGITWNDGPGSITSSHYDIQSVMAHEYGHAIGLGHTSTMCSSCSNLTTMCSFICNGQTNQRTIASDDVAGLEFVYGTIPSNKPLITGLSGSFVKGGTLVIQGSNFAASVNVKFTAGTGVNTGTIPGVVYGATSTGGGTQISVTIPTDAMTGNVLVWEPAISRLSNAFPIEISDSPWVNLGGGTTGINGPPTLTMSGPLTPSSTLGLDLVDGAASSLSVLFISITSTPVAFLGGTLHAFPILDQVVLFTDGLGEIHGSTLFPGGASGGTLYFQVGISDPSVPVFLASLSNGVKGTVP